MDNRWLLPFQTMLIVPSGPPWHISEAALIHPLRYGAGHIMGTCLSTVPLSGLALLSIWCKVQQQILAFEPPSNTLIIFYTNVSVCKVTKPEVYCVLIYLLYTGMKCITPSPLNCHDGWSHFTQMTCTKPAEKLILTVNPVREWSHWMWHVLLKIAWSISALTP